MKKMYIYPQTASLTFEAGSLLADASPTEGMYVPINNESQTDIHGAPGRGPKFI